MDDAIVRKRLATSETNTSSNGPRRICQELLALAVSSPGDFVGKRERYKTTQAQFQFTVSRLGAIESRCREELEYYAGREAASTAALSEAVSEVGRLRAELERVKAQREHKREYEALAASLAQLPTRGTYAAELEGAEKECREAMGERAGLEARLGAKKAAFQLFLSALHDLRTLEVEDTERAARVAREAAEAETLEAQLALGQQQQAAGAAGGGGGAEEGEDSKVGRGREGGDGEGSLEVEQEVEEEEGGQQQDGEDEGAGGAEGSGEGAGEGEGGAMEEEDNGGGGGEGSESGGDGGEGGGGEEGEDAAPALSIALVSIETGEVFSKEEAAAAQIPLPPGGETEEEEGETLDDEPPPPPPATTSAAEGIDSTMAEEQ